MLAKTQQTIVQTIFDLWLLVGWIQNNGIESKIECGIYAGIIEAINHQRQYQGIFVLGIWGCCIKIGFPTRISLQ